MRIRQRQGRGRGAALTHGRIERRTIQVLPAPEKINFPHAAQVFLVERYVADLHANPTSAVAVLGVTSRPTERADPAQIATALRRHWEIENGLHYVRSPGVHDLLCGVARTG